MIWEPAVYEHKAALIGRSPLEVANSADLLAQAVLKEYEIYRADYITVGIDVYNVEAEALGAKLCVPNKDACPELAGPLYDLHALPRQWETPPIPESGRFSLLLAAGQRVQEAIGNLTHVRVAASGPLTLASKLVGAEPLILSLYLEDGLASDLLDFTARFSEAWCGCLRGHGLDVVLLDSIVAPPMFSPSMFQQVALPSLRRLLSVLKDSGQRECELVIGGDTAPIAQSLPGTGADILLCDYAADATAFRSAMEDSWQGRVRRNVNPALLRHDCDQVVTKFLDELCLFPRPIAGTGVLPYDFPPQRLIEFKQKVSRAIAQGAGLRRDNHAGLFESFEKNE